MRQINFVLILCNIAELTRFITKNSQQGLKKFIFTYRVTKFEIYPHFLHAGTQCTVQYNKIMFIQLFLGHFSEGNSTGKNRSEITYAISAREKGEVFY